MNLTEDEVIEYVTHSINNSDPSQRNEALEREFLTDLVTGIDGWDKSPATLGRMIPCAASYLILLRLDENRFREGIGIIVHEIVHAAHYLLRHRRVPLNEDTEEVYAYLIEHLYVEVLNALYD